MKANAIIVAGGTGKRFGAKKPKQFLDLCGKPIFLWSVLTFLKDKNFKKVIVVVPNDYVNALSKKYKKFKNVVFVCGGKERFDSVKSGLLSVDDDADFVAIHDGARPLITNEDISNILQSAVKNNAAIAADKTKDTIKVVKNNIVQHTLDRNFLYNIQTPQIFKTNLLKKAYSKKIPKNTTDDGALVEKFYKKIAIVQTKNLNFKITNPMDFLMAKFILSKRKK